MCKQSAERANQLAHLCLLFRDSVDLDRDLQTMIKSVSEKFDDNEFKALLQEYYQLQVAHEKAVRQMWAAACKKRFAKDGEIAMALRQRPESGEGRLPEVRPAA